MWDLVKSTAEVNLSVFLHINQGGCLVKAIRLVRHDLLFVVLCWMCPETFFFDISVPGNSFQVDLLYNLPSWFLNYSSVHLFSVTFPVSKESSVRSCYTFLWRNSSFCLFGMSLLKCLPKGPCLARHPTVVLWAQRDQSSEAAHGYLIDPVCIP